MKAEPPERLAEGLSAAIHAGAVGMLPGIIFARAPARRRAWGERGIRNNRPVEDKFGYLAGRSRP